MSSNILLIFFTLFTLTKSTCVTDCPSLCYCHEQNITSIPSMTKSCYVNCSAKNFTFAPELPDKVSWIILSNNQISSVTSVTKNKYILIELDLSQNEIENLSTLDLSMTNLQILNLAHNKIKTIPANLFEDLSSLRQLYLNHNSITSLPEPILPVITTLRILKLHNNELALLSEDIFNEVLTNVDNISLFGNPWLCDCQLSWLQSWVSANQDRVENSALTVCSSPNFLANQEISAVDLNLAKCADSYISCTTSDKEDEKIFIVWRYVTSNETVVASQSACYTVCFSKGYYYGLYLPDEQSCLCGIEDSENVIYKNNQTEWSLCMQACAVGAVSACNREVVEGSVFHASPQISFNGLRIYSAYELVELTLTLQQPDIELEYMWNFNDTDTTLYFFATTTPTMQHRFFSSGEYIVTVVAMNGLGSETFLLTLKIEEPVFGLTIHCPEEISPDETPQVEVKLAKGLTPSIVWSATKGGEVIHDQSFCPTASYYLAAENSCYEVFYQALTWENARTSCINKGGDLAVVDSNVVQQFLISDVFSERSSKYWIGLNDHQLEGTFMHISGVGIDSFQPWSTDSLHSTYPQSYFYDYVYMNIDGYWEAANGSDTNSFVCQFKSPDKLNSPNQFSDGVMVFEDNSAPFKNATIDTEHEPDNYYTQYILLFPGLWITKGGKINRFEAVTQHGIVGIVYDPDFRTNNENHFSFKILRPNCNSTQSLITPSCLSQQTAYSTCDAYACSSVASDQCSVDEKYCPYSADSSYCRNPVAPCNLYNEKNSSTSLNHAYNIPDYSIVGSYKIKIDADLEYNQLVIEDGFNIKANDVIGVGFESSKSIDEFEEDVSKLKLKCVESNLSSWRQDAMLFRTSNNQTVLDNETVYVWLRSLWCSVRVHYSQPSETSISPAFMRQTDPGEYHYTAYAINSISNTKADAQTCTIRVKDEIQEIVLEEPTQSVYVDDELTVYVALGARVSLSFRVVGGGRNTTTNWTLISAGVETFASENEAVNSTCVTESNCTFTTNRTIEFDSIGNTTILVQGSNSVSNATTQVRIVTEEAITGIKILPENLTRILVGVSQIFEGSYDTGTNVTTEWVVDDLVQYKVVQPTYNVLFRKASSYKITMILKNHVSTLNYTIILSVEDRFQLSDFSFDASNPDIIESQIAGQYGFEAYADYNLDIKVTWSFDGNSEPPLIFTQPHAGLPKVSGQQYQIVLGSYFNKTFSTTERKTIRVIVEDDYGDVLNEISDVDVRHRLTSLTVDLDNGIKPALNENLMISTTVQPSSYKTTFQYDWGDGSAIENSSQSTESHIFTSIGSYNVSVTANNDINSVSSWKVIRIYHRVTGLKVATDTPTELGETTTLSTTIDNYDATEISYQFDSEAVSDITNETLNSVDHKTVRFIDATFYNVTVTVANPISQQTVTEEIQVFKLRIDSVEQPNTCSESNVPVNFKAILPTEREDLFLVDWDFGDGSTLSTVNGSTNVTHHFTSANYFFATVRVTSKRTNQYTDKNFTVCSQEAIPTFTLSPSKPVVETGFPINFSTDPSIGGTDVNVTVDFGDGTPVIEYTVSDVISHNYTDPGNYTVVLYASNLVSFQNITCMAIVQDRISDITITTDSGYQTSVPVNHVIQYTAHYKGSDATVQWDFADAVKDIGNPVDHTYINIDSYNLKANVSNAISSLVKSVEIVVLAAVSGISLHPIPDIVQVGTTVEFSATAPSGTSYTFYWKVYPSTSENWDKVGTDKFYSHQFNTADNFTIVLKAENQASSVNHTDSLVVAEPLSDLYINSNQFVWNGGRDYAAVNENISMFLLFSDGAPLSDNTFGSVDLISVEWSVDGVPVKNETILFEVFTNIGTHSIEANVSNTISFLTVTKSLELIERISNVTFEKTGFHQALVTGQEAQLTVNSQGTDIHYTWKPDVNLDVVDNIITSQFRHIYPSPGFYQIQVNLSNKLGNVVESYPLYVQDVIEGLKVEHLESVKPFYVGVNLNAKFEATVTNGTSVWYTWQYFNGDSGSTRRIINTNVIYWNFSMTETYRLNIKAQNNVSIEELNQTVIVIDPVAGLTLSVSKNLVTTNSTVTAMTNIDTGTDVSYWFDFGDSSPVIGGNIISTTQASALHEYKANGAFWIVVEAFNNATLVNETQMVIVRDPIVGLQINGIQNNQYIVRDEFYSISASILEGTAVEFNWTITSPDSTSVTHTNISMLNERFPVVGRYNILLTANNLVNTTSVTIDFFVLDAPQFKIEVVTAEDEVYLNDNVTLHVTTLRGTDVLYDVDFGDDTPVIYNSMENTFIHAYTKPNTYVIVVYGHNDAKSRNRTTEVTIKMLECGEPELSFVGGAIQTQYYRSRSLYLETELNLFGCTAYTVRYHWSIFKQNDCVVVNEANKVLLPVLTFYNQLNLSPLTLDVSKYCVRVTASYIDTPLQHSIYTIIEIISTPLAVVISGGTYRFVSQSQQVVLDASTSFDPDLAGNQTPLDYSWTCTSKDRLPSDEDYGFTNSNNVGNLRINDGCFVSNFDEKIAIQANTLLVGKEYNFTVTAKKLGKMNVSSWQIVVIVADQIPTVTVSCYSCRHQSSLQISSSHRLSLVGACTSCKLIDKVSYFWEATRKNSSSGPTLPFVLNQETTTTNNNIKYLVLRDGYVLDFYEYEFKLTISVNNQTGFSKLVLYANKPPVNGNCSISYDGDQIYVLETLVRFDCIGWEDEDISPLVYTILAIRYDGDIKVDEFVIYFGTISSYEAYIPLGFKSNNYNVIIQILVEDEFGTFTVALNETVSVRLREVHTLDWLLDRTAEDFVKLEKANNPQVINDFAAGVITVLNQESETNVEEDFETRREIRNNITRTVAALEPNTIDEIQQITTVFKQCLIVPSELQDTSLQNISVEKVIALSEQLPDYVDLATPTTFLQVTNNLLDIVSYMVQSVNFHVYVTGEALNPQVDGDEILTVSYREEMVRKLMVSANKITDNVLQSKVTGEEPVFLNASSFSSFGARTTPATMNRSISNDGCHIQLPPSLFLNIEDTTEIIYIFSVAEQNPYTFGFRPSTINLLGIENISSRVPTLQFSYPNTTEVRVTDVGIKNTTSLESPQDLNDLIKMVMAQSNQQFIDPQITNEIASITTSSFYSPWDGVEFQSQPLNSLISVTFAVQNNNTDPDVAVYIMVIFEKNSVSTKLEANPFLDVYFDFLPNPNIERYSKYFRLTEDMVTETANHMNYTIYLDPIDLHAVNKEYYFNITNYFQHHNLNVKIGVFYSSCQFFDPNEVEWSKLGLRTSAETIPSVSVCYTSHLTSFGSFVISPPIIITINDIKNLDFGQNPIALIVVSVLFVAYILGAIWCRRLDLRDIESVSLIPLCGTNGAHKYEITVKTSPGLGSGTTANVGICVYGYESRSGSKHLYKKGAFQRGSVDVFQIATHNYIGSIYKIKIWHDNTGLDPAWNVSRVMVRDLKSGEKYYFLVDSWLQVYPEDENETCLQKVVPVASDEEMCDFSLRFGTQLSYGWEDAHLWLSLIERPPQSRFTRFQRITCCALLLYTFMVLSAMWYQGYDVEEYDQTDIGEIRWRDIAVGAIVSLMVFPINLIVVFMFKKSKSYVSPTKPWPERAQTAQTLEILDEILDERSKTKFQSKRSLFGSMLSDQTLGDDVTRKNWFPDDDDDKKDEINADSLSGSVARFTSSDTGISTGDDFSSYTNEITPQGGLRRRNTGLAGDLWDPFLSDDESDIEDVKLEEEDFGQTRTMPANLRRTQKACFSESPFEIPEYESFPQETEASTVEFDKISQGSIDIIISGKSEEPFILPHFFIYIAYFLCYSGMLVSIFFIVVYGDKFGTETTGRWLISLLVALLESFFLIEPIKVVLLAVFVASFTKQHSPEQNDNLVENPLVETYEHVKKNNKIRPPAGFALEKCKNEAKLASKAHKSVIQFSVYLLFISFVLGFALWDKDSSAYWSNWTVGQMLYKTSVYNPGLHGEQDGFNEIKTTNDLWAWMENVLAPIVLQNDPDNLNSTNSYNHLLGGSVRFRQQRIVPNQCSGVGNKYYSQITSRNTCIDSNKEDTALYDTGWSNTLKSNLSWIYSPATNPGMLYWGQERIYDDSGYFVYLDSNSASQQISLLRNENWIDRFTRVCFVEFTQLNPNTYWFTVSTVMFEIGSTGAIQPSHYTQTIRLFHPSQYFTVGTLFMGLIGVICILLLVNECVKIYHLRSKIKLYFEKTMNWFNLLVVATTIVLCCLFIYQEVFMEEMMNIHKSNRATFNNFYQLAVISNAVTYTTSFLLALLMIKTVRLLRFIRCWYSLGETLSRGFNMLLGTTFLFLILVLTFAQFGYLVFGLGSTHVLEDFSNYQNSLYTMFRAFRGRFNALACYEANPAFSIIFFLSYYFLVFAIFCRLFAAILNKEYKLNNMRRYRPKTYIAEYEVMDYIVRRIKLRLGIIKPKQYRANVRFEGMSTPSSQGSFASIDSFGTCFTPGRISQCSDATGLSASSSDSGLGIQSDHHSASLFDYLTLEHPPDEKPMDSLHIDYLYNRLSSYSVDMMLHRFERVNKLSEDVLSMETKLLSMKQKSAQQELMKPNSNEIAVAASSTTISRSDTTSLHSSEFINSRATTTSNSNLKSRKLSSEKSRFDTVVGSMFPDSSSSDRKYTPVRSSSYTGDHFLKQPSSAESHQRHTISSANQITRINSAKKASLKKRPHSDEGVRVQDKAVIKARNNAHKSHVLTKKSAW